MNDPNNRNAAKIARTAWRAELYKCCETLQLQFHYESMTIRTRPIYDSFGLYYVPTFTKFAARTFEPLFDSFVADSCGPLFMQCWIVTIQTDEAEQQNRRSWTSYTYETFDRSKKHIAANDLVFLRDQTRLLAVAHVERATTEKLEQTVPKCPQCGIAQIEMRKKGGIPYRCFYGHQFTAPTETSQSTTKHTVHFAHNWARIAAQIESAELRPFELTNSRHAKLKLAHIGGLCAYVARRDHTVAPLLKTWLRTHTPELGDNDAAEPVAAHPMSIFDEQERPHQSIRARRGLASFRDKLINRYGSRCMISGCSVLALLEACHVSRYRGPEDNHPTNGILLRSDLHTLFDLDLIGLDPFSMTVIIDPSLVGTEYEKFAGTRLLLAGEKTIDMRAMRSRWDQFCQKARPVAHGVTFAALGLQAPLPQFQ